MFDSFKGHATTKGLRSVNERPALAAHIGLIVAMWAMVESQLSELLSIMLHADAAIGATLFSVIKNEGGRLAMLKAVAEERLTPEQQAEYASLKKRITAAGDYRDRLAHNIWATSPDYPDSLILFDARASAHFVALYTKAIAVGRFSDQDDASASCAITNYLESARVYSEKFLHIEAEITAASDDLGRFCWKLKAPTPLPHPEAKP
ncbi:MAG: hypothetical protein NVSMB34_07520 [Variovorax sp.]